MTSDGFWWNVPQWSDEENFWLSLLGVSFLWIAENEIGILEINSYAFSLLCFGWLLKNAVVSMDKGKEGVLVNKNSN